jgi:PST family polysaccharide transporter
MTKEKKLLSNFFYLFLLQGLTFILPLITAPYLFRVLGAEKFGLVSFSLVIIAFLRIIVDYGFQLTATREVALHRDEIEILNDIFSQTMITKFILLIFSFLLLTFLIIFINIFSENWILFYSSFLFVVGHALFPMWFFQGVEEMKYISYLNILSKLFFTISVFLFINSPMDYLLYPLFNGLGVIFIGIYALYIMFSKYKIRFIMQPITKIYTLIKIGWNVFLGEIAPTLYTNFTTFLLGFFVSMESVGYLTLANRFVSATTSILYIARNVTFPYLNKNPKQFKKITSLMIFIGLFFTLFLFSFSDIFVPFLFGEKSFKILELVYVLAISPTLYAVILSFGSNYLLVLKEDEKYKKIVISISIFGTGLSLILVPYFHLFGGAFTIICIQLLLALFLVKYSLKLHKIRKKIIQGSKINVEKN